MQVPLCCQYSHLMTFFQKKAVIILIDALDRLPKNCMAFFWIIYEPTLCFCISPIGFKKPSDSLLSALRFSDSVQTMLSQGMNGQDPDKNMAILSDPKTLMIW